MKLNENLFYLKELASISTLCKAQYIQNHTIYLRMFGDLKSCIREIFGISGIVCFASLSLWYSKRKILTCKQGTKIALQNKNQRYLIEQY